MCRIGCPGTGTGVAMAICAVCLQKDTVASMQRQATGSYVCSECVTPTPAQEAGSVPALVPTPAPNQKPPARGQETGPATTTAI